MKIGLVYTYPPSNCGIGIYTKLLTNALLQLDPKIDINVIAEKGADSRTEEPLEVQVAYERKNNYAPKILEATKESKVELLHIQYFPELFGEDNRLPSLVASLSSLGIKVVITLHTIKGPRWYRTLSLSRPTALFTGIWLKTPR